MIRIKKSILNKKEKTFEKNLSDSIRPEFEKIPETTGTNAEFIAPSANTLLKSFECQNLIQHLLHHFYQIILIYLQ